MAKRKKILRVIFENQTSRTIIIYFRAIRGTHKLLVLATCDPKLIQSIEQHNHSTLQPATRVVVRLDGWRAFEGVVFNAERIRDACITGKQFMHYDDGECVVLMQEKLN